MGVEFQKPINPSKERNERGGWNKSKISTQNSSDIKISIVLQVHNFIKPRLLLCNQKLEVAVVFVCIVYIYTLLFILAIEECNEFFYQYKKPRIARPIFIGAMFEMNAMML